MGRNKHSPKVVPDQKNNIQHPCTISRSNVHLRYISDSTTCQDNANASNTRGTIRQVHTNISTHRFFRRVSCLRRQECNPTLDCGIFTAAVSHYQAGWLRLYPSRQDLRLLALILIYRCTRSSTTVVQPTAGSHGKALQHRAVRCRVCIALFRRNFCLPLCMQTRDCFVVGWSSRRAKTAARKPSQREKALWSHGLISTSHFSVTYWCTYTERCILVPAPKGMKNTHTNTSTHTSWDFSFTAIVYIFVFWSLVHLAGGPETMDNSIILNPSRELLNHETVVPARLSLTHTTTAEQTT